MGFGCISPFKETYLEAFRAGFRHLDTAFAHRNHGAVGAAMRESGLPRHELFLTTKVGGLAASQLCCFGLLKLPGCLTDPDPLDPGAGAGNYVKGRELEGVRLALRETGLEYLDLCLIHRPGATALEMHASYVPHYSLNGKITTFWAREAAQALLNAALRWESLGGAGAAGGGGAAASSGRALRAESWRQLEEARRRGYCRHIGVSNYPLGALEELEGYATLLPEVIQLEHTPLFQQRDVLAYARRRGIAVTGYGTSVAKGLLAELLRQVGQAVGRTPNQVLQRWRLQHGVGILQGSMHPQHMRENLAVTEFELPQEAMDALDRLEAHFPFYFDMTWFEAHNASLVQSSAVLLSALFLGTLGGFGFCCGCCCCGCCGYLCRRGTPAAAGAAKAKEKKDS